MPKSRTEVENVRMGNSLEMETRSSFDNCCGVPIQIYCVLAEFRRRRLEESQAVRTSSALDIWLTTFKASAAEQWAYDWTSSAYIGVTEKGARSQQGTNVRSVQNIEQRS